MVRLKAGDGRTKRSRFSEEQIIAMLKEQEAGVATAHVCRKHGVSSATFYKWTAKYGVPEVSDARRLQALEDENAKLKRLLAEQMLDNAMRRNATAKKVVTPAAKRSVLAHLTEAHGTTTPATRIRPWERPTGQVRSADRTG